MFEQAFKASSSPISSSRGIFDNRTATEGDFFSNSRLHREIHQGAHLKKDGMMNLKMC